MYDEIVTVCTVVISLESPLNMHIKALSADHRVPGAAANNIDVAFQHVSVANILEGDRDWSKT